MVVLDYDNQITILRLEKEIDVLINPLIAPPLNDAMSYGKAHATCFAFFTPCEKK